MWCNFVHEIEKSDVILNNVHPCFFVGYCQIMRSSHLLRRLRDCDSNIRRTTLITSTNPAVATEVPSTAAGNMVKTAWTSVALLAMHSVRCAREKPTWFLRWVQPKVHPHHQQPQKVMMSHP